MIRRMTTLFAAVIVSVLGFSTAAMAANYPPSVQGTDTGVKGVKVGAGGLAGTGFNNTLVLAAMALLAVGLVLLVMSRRRRHSS